MTIIQTLSFVHTDAYRCSVNETVLVNTSCENKFTSIGSGENVMSESFTNDKFCEELSHPHLFPTGKFGFKQREKCSSRHRNISISDC